MPHFDSPLAFLLLLLIPVTVYFYFRKKRKAGIRFSSTRYTQGVPVSLRQQFSILPFVLRILALVFFILALARPQEKMELVQDISKGVAIEMVVDRSGSMSYMKDFGRKTLTRLDVVKQAFSEFVAGGNSSLSGRPNDLIGMITFARYADTTCPLTLSHGALLRFIDSVKTVEPDSIENATSIGDGIALAAARLKTAEAGLAEQSNKQKSNYKIKSKVIILLTDGEDTGTGKRSPRNAAETAKEWGIKIYTIGLSGEGWYAKYNDPFFGVIKKPANSHVDEVLLTEIAESTGGIYGRATGIDSLREIYKEIDTLEKSEIESSRYVEYKENFTIWVIIGLILLTAEFVLSRTLFRRIP